MFASLRRKKAERESARQLYDQVVAAARSPSLYTVGGVPDTVDGRFEMVVLHTYLVVGRLMSGDDSPQRVAQFLFDTMITDMDRSLREMGVGDLSVGKKVKAMAEAYYGRSQAYDAALEASDAELADAIRRNIFGTLEADGNEQNPVVTAMVRYIRSTMRSLQSQSIDALTQGHIQFVEYS
tara:strand:+ start:3874 stop:4416 length:543 start_codon:yes stop_codon:yes gene_type:complete